MKKFECNYCHEKFSGFSIYDCPNCGSGDICQIMDDKLCGWQPKGKAEDVPKPHKYNLNAEFWRTQWSEASGAHLMEYLRAEKLQEQLNTAKKYIEHVIGTIKHDGHLGTIQTDWILPDLEKALAAIGGDDESLDN
jgi:hypothetical protein